MHILVTGAAGRLGGRLVEVLTRQGHQVTGVSHRGGDFTALDITDYESTCEFIAGLRPDVVIHPAAWTDVDGCTRDPARAVVVNGLGTQHVALGAAAANASLLYVSSNEVFDGQATRPYQEYDHTSPVNPYGYSKWVGERALLHINSRHYVVRTSWLFAHGGRNFIHAILNAARAGKNLRVVTNEIANPTYNDDLADAISSLVDTGRYGIYHFVNEGTCSRYDFARYVLNQAGMGDVPVTPISSHEWPRASTPAPYSALANVAGKHIGITLRPWREAVRAFLEKEGLLSR